MPPHPDFARPNGVWGNTFVPTADDIYFWTATTARALNGDGGGVYAPAKPIIVGGAGIQLPAGASIIKGGVTTRNAGMIQHGDGDYTEVSPSRARNVLIDAFSAISGANVPPGGKGAQPLTLSVPPAPVGIVPGDAAPTIIIPTRFLHQGATLAAVKLNFRYLGPLSTIPAKMVLAFGSSSLTGAVLQPDTNGIGFVEGWLANHTYAAGAFVQGQVPGHANGFYAKCINAGTSDPATEPVLPPVIGGSVADGSVLWETWGQSGSLPATAYASAATAYNAGKPQQLVATMSSPMVVDTTASVYFVELQSGGTGLVVITSIELDYTGIADLRAE